MVGPAPPRDPGAVRQLSQILAVLTLLMCLASLWTVERGCAREAPASALEELAKRLTTALPMAAPVAGQKRAPCAKAQRESGGACWWAYTIEGADADVAEQCARDDLYEMTPGACAKTRRAYRPVMSPRPNSVK